MGHHRLLRRSIAAAFVMFAIGRTHLIGLIVGVVLLDGGFQGLQVTNQSIVYRLSTDSVSRVTTAYMGTVFVSGAVGSAAAALAYATGGWYAVCILGGTLGSLAVLLWCVTERPHDPEQSDRRFRPRATRIGRRPYPALPLLRRAPARRQPRSPV